MLFKNCISAAMDVSANLESQVISLCSSSDKAMQESMPLPLDPRSNANKMKNKVKLQD